MLLNLHDTAFPLQPLLFVFNVLNVLNCSYRRFTLSSSNNIHRLESSVTSVSPQIVSLNQSGQEVFICGLFKGVNSGFGTAFMFTVKIGHLFNLMFSGLDSFLHLVSLEFMFSVTMCKNVNAYHDVFG